MNEFSNNKAIYLQIADDMADRVLMGTLEADKRVPSVREYAASVGVNVNTVVKAYDYLDAAGIIYNRRGLGYYVSGDAREKTVAMRRRELEEGGATERFFRQIHLLGISPQELVQMYNNYIENEANH